ncbi:MAG: hypothetical protein QXD82_04965 [Nitrososphaerales archaeon]
MDERLLDQNTRGGKTRLKILSYLLENGPSTCYQVAKSVFSDHGPGSGFKYHKAVDLHIQKMEKEFLVERQKVGNRELIHVTSNGEIQAQRIGIYRPPEQKAFLNSLCILASNKLEEDVLERGKELLTLKMINHLRKMIEIAGYGTRIEQLDPVSAYIILALFKQEREMAEVRVELSSIKLQKTMGLSKNQLKYKLLDYVRDNQIEEGIKELAEWFKGVEDRIEVFGWLHWLIRPLSMGIAFFKGLDFASG